MFSQVSVILFTGVWQTPPGRHPPPPPSEIATTCIPTAMHSFTFYVDVLFEAVFLTVDPYMR